MRRANRIILALLLLGTLLILGMVHLVALGADDPEARRHGLAMARMTVGLVLIWIVLGGALMWRWREVVRAWFQAIPLGWPLKFLLMATALACAEEAVTVSMTNLAPLFGSDLGRAYITASTNYLDVVLLHSVVVFVPFFIVMVFLLRCFDFSPMALFLSFGLVGSLSEAVFAASPAALIGLPMWCFVYGLMVWLPAYCLPHRPTARKPGIVAHLLLTPAILLLALPMIAPLVYLISVVLEHPAIHFETSG